MGNIELYKDFLIKFENQIRHLIVDANCKFEYEFTENEHAKLKIYTSYLSNDTIELLQKYFKAKYIIGTGILNNRDLVCINIF